MVNSKYLWIGAFMLLLLVTSCSNTLRENQARMGNGMMNSDSTESGATQISPLPRSITGLSESQKSQILEIKDMETYNLEANPVVKEISGDNIRMYGTMARFRALLLR